jgi:type 1 glutamine amidotransferase
MTRKNILFIGGYDGHSDGSHEALAGLRLLKNCVDTLKNTGTVETELVESWPERKDTAFDELVRKADCFVFLGDWFPLRRLEANAKRRGMAKLDRAVKQGAGMVCLHYALGGRGKNNKLVEWTGGLFWVKRSTHSTFKTKILLSGKKHPVLNGCTSFPVYDEVYYKYYFGENGNPKNITPLAYCMIPPENPQKEIVAWAYERPDGGRSFVSYATHFFANWKKKDLRTMALNGIIWTAGLNVPKGGVQSLLPKDLSVFKPKSVHSSFFKG